MASGERGGYVLGDSRSELDRLERQARFYAPGTEALFDAAGIAPGMRVLDIGSGAGDVSMLAAFAHVHGDLDMGMRVFETFTKARLPDPKLLNWAPAVTRAEPEGYYIMASLMRRLTPMLVQAGLVREDEIGIDTLERRLIEEVSDKGHIYIWSPLVGAWSNAS
ncbi:MAG TPA: hypothetical protein VFV07_13785 [Rhizomicrobium sp.]|nr:hypothetical protein [Rhizomicrobium sp.]